MTARLAPSLMCADPLAIGRDIETLDRAGVDVYHIDLMDGHFVPNLGLTVDLIRRVQAVTQTPLDVHLMVENPSEYLPRLAGLRIQGLSFHYEAERYPLRLLREIHRLGFRAGIALNPTTPAEAVRYFAQELDYVLLMMFEPGFAGLPFVPEMLDKIAVLRQIAAEKDHPLSIQVDGAITTETARLCLERGADTLILGYLSIFDGRELYQATVEFRDSLTGPDRLSSHTEPSEESRDSSQRALLDP